MYYISISMESVESFDETLSVSAKRDNALLLDEQTGDTRMGLIKG